VVRHGRGRPFRNLWERLAATTLPRRRPAARDVGHSCLATAAIRGAGVAARHRVDLSDLRLSGRLKHLGFLDSQQVLASRCTVPVILGTGSRPTLHGPSIT
jgi:hypothetical protein